MINVIKLLLTNQIHKHMLIIASIEICYFIDLKFLIFQQLIVYIFLFVFRKIVFQYKLLIDQTKILLICTSMFTIINYLLCNHKIQNCMYINKTLMLKNVYLH